MYDLVSANLQMMPLGRNRAPNYLVKSEYFSSNWDSYYLLSTYHIPATVLSYMYNISLSQKFNEVVSTITPCYRSINWDRPREAEWLVCGLTADIWWILDLSPEFTLLTTITPLSEPEQPSPHLKFRTKDSTASWSCFPSSWNVVIPGWLSKLCSDHPTIPRENQPRTAWTSLRGA